MRYQVVVVGRPREALAPAIREYEARAARYWPLEVSEVREESARSAPPDTVREREGERLLERAGPSARIIACDEEGTRLRSSEFAALMRREQEAARDVAFVIGGAYGLAPAVRDRASMLLSLAPWTLPHEMARLVLAEQLYRAGSIARGEPYHK